MFRKICASKLAGFLRTYALTGLPTVNYIYPTKQVIYKSPSFTYSSLSREWTCEGCGNSNSKRVLICAKCDRIIDPTHLKTFTYFEVLDQDRTFDINSSDLATKFRRLQGLLHPDKFAQKNEKEQSYSEEISARVNVAYQTLLKPNLRGEYLLKLNGKPFEEKSVQMDQEFLAIIMESNESVSNCESLEDARRIQAENDVHLKEYYQKMSVCFSRNDLDGAMMCLAKLNYYENLNEKLKDLVMKFT